MKECGKIEIAALLCAVIIGHKQSLCRMLLKCQKIKIVSYIYRQVFSRK